VGGREKAVNAVVAAYCTGLAGDSLIGRLSRLRLVCLRRRV